MTQLTKHPHRRIDRRHVAVVIVAAVAVACAGGDVDDTAPAGPTSTPTATEPGDDRTATTVVPGATTAPQSTESPGTTLEPESGECPVDALADTGEPVPIEIWHAMSATTGVVFEELIADYNVSQDRVLVTPVYQGGYTETFGKYINTLRSGGDLPTIIQLSEISLQQMIDSRSIVSIDDCIAADSYDLTDFPELLLDQYRVDGRLVTMPFQLANPVLFYDGNDFVAAGLDPDDPPVTLDELVETSRALVEAGAVTSGIALQVDAWPFEQWVATAGAALVDHDNGRSGRAERSLLADQAVTDLLTTLAEMNREGLLLSTGRGGEQAGLAQFIAVAQGDAAMTIASSATLGEIYEQIGRVPDVDVRVGPFPVSGEGKTTIGGGSIYLTNDTTDAERSAAWDLIVWLNEPAQQVRWSSGTGYVPTRTSAVADPTLQQLWADQPGFRVAYDQIAAPGELPGGGGPVIGDYAGVRDAIEDGLEALYGGAEVAAVQAEIQDAADQAIADYNGRIGD